MGTHLDSSFIIVIDGAGHNVGRRVGLRGAVVMRLLGGVLLGGDGGEGRPGGAEHGEVSRVGVGVKSGRGVQQRVAGGEEGGAPQLRGPPQLVNVILELLQLLEVGGLQGGRVQEGGTGGSWKKKIT